MLPDGPSRRAARLVALAGGAVHLPRPSVALTDSDLPDPARPAFVQGARVEDALDAEAIAQDDPEALRAAGPKAVGSALWRLSSWGALAPWREAREAAALLRDHLSDGMHFDTLDLDLGLRPRNGRPSLSLVAKRAERDDFLVKLSQSEPWAGMGPWRAATALRDAFAAYETTRWPREAERPTAPATEPVGTFWRICRLALPQGGMPKAADLARLLREDRERRGR